MIKRCIISFIITLTVGGLIAPLPVTIAGDGDPEEPTYIAPVDGTTLIHKEIASWQDITI